MLSKKNHIINYFKEVKYISDQIGISKIEKNTNQTGSNIFKFKINDALHFEQRKRKCIKFKI